jgi:hypothetical protein
VTQFITLEERDYLFEISRHVIQFLYHKAQQELQDVYLNKRLLRRLQLAIIKCHGFTPAQKDDICFICDLSAWQEGLPPYPDHWYVLRTIGPRLDITHDVVEVSHAQTKIMNSSDSDSDVV